MSYFKNFPKTVFEINGKEYIVKDIFRRAMFISEYKPYSDLYTTYTISDGETPQMLAHNIYGSVDFDWVILVFNEIHNPYFDWPLRQYELDSFVKNKYGETTMNMVKYYTRNGLVIGESKDWVSGETWIPPTNPGPQDPTVYPVTFIEYETELNEARRTIHILRPELLGDFTSQFTTAINGDFN